MATNDNFNTGNRLQELSGSDFEIAEGQPDIRGWTVKDQQGKTIGEVDELIFDVQSRKVRYIVLDIEGDVLDLEPRNVLVPIGIAQLHEKDDDVLLPGVTASQLNALPVYSKGNISAATETSVRDAFAGLGVAGAAAADDTDFYDHDHFNEDNLYQTRRNAGGGTAIPIIEEELQVGKAVVETGGARIQSTIVEHPVEERITLKEERVQVERTPVDRPASEADLARFKETEVSLTEHAEVPVVSKAARVVEEVTLGKEVSTREEVIRDTVRKTEVDVENLTQSDSTRQNIQPE